MFASHPGRALALGLFGFPALLSAQDLAQHKREVVRHHTAWSHQLYGQVRQRAAAMHERIVELTEQPSAANLAAARKAWLHARELYGMTEALRFHDGPIETREPLLNAWPIDEAYVDYVEGRRDCGIVNDAERFPTLAAPLLVLANERGGEANICVGWHAIEFLLWGQDLSADGPGARPFTDYVVGKAANAARRGQYLRAVSALLVQHLSELQREWAPGAKYRVRFEKEVEASVRRILVGVTVLTAFELGGERMVVAYETQDQEQEHSCFSDNTWQDFVSNQLGLMAVVLGSEVGGSKGPGLIELVRDQLDVADALEAALRRTEKALRAIPKPFDRAFLGPDDGPGRKAMLRAIESLEQQTELLLIVGKQLGHDLPVEPGE
jgi:putative iron-regulated protein